MATLGIAHNHVQTFNQQIKYKPSGHSLWRDAEVVKAWRRNGPDFHKYKIITSDNETINMDFSKTNIDWEYLTFHYTQCINKYST